MIEIIVNSVNKNSLKKLEQLKSILLEKNIEYKILLTTKNDTAENLIKKTTGKKVIVIGGDGTINEVINGYNNQKIIYLARGTGNDLARSLKLIDANYDNIEGLVSKTVGKRYDCGLVNDKKFCSCFDLGFNADIIANVEKSNTKKYFRKYTYTIYGLLTVLKLKKYKARIIVDNEVIETNNLKCLNIMVQRFSGGGIEFAKDASGSDGKLHVMILKDMSYFKFIYNYLCLLLKKQHLMKGVYKKTASRVEIEINQKYYQIDGELVYNSGNLAVECLNNYYEIINS